MTTPASYGVSASFAVEDDLRRILLGHLLLAKKPYGVALYLVEHGQRYVRDDK